MPHLYFSSKDLPFFLLLLLLNASYFFFFRVLLPVRREAPTRYRSLMKGPDAAAVNDDESQ